MNPRSGDSGNVVLEVASAVMVFGMLLLPAASSLSSIVLARRQADAAVFEVARVWTVTKMQSRLIAARQAAAALERAGTLPMRIAISCGGSCSRSSSRVDVSAVVQVGVPMVQSVSARQQLLKSSYAP